jgi:hypothetical protein
MLLLTIPPGLEAQAQSPEGPLRLEGARVTFGPGRNPGDGEGRAPAAFQPMLSGNLVLAGGIPKGAQWRLWRVASSALPSLRKGAALHPSLGEPLQAEWKIEGEGLAFVAPWRGGDVRPEDRVVVELRVRGRRRALASSPIQARYLPAAPRGGRDIE